MAERAWWCRECEGYVEAVERHRCFGRYCPNGCEGSCDSVPDARPLRSRIARLEAANAALVDLCEEYEAQWGDDYLAKKWGLKESLKAIKGASLSADNCVCYLWPGTCAMHPQEPGREQGGKDT